MMTKYITATVLVGRLIEEHGSLFVQGGNLARLVQQLAVCDRETAILEREIRHLEAENQRVRLQIQQRDVEIYRLRAVCAIGSRNCPQGARRPDFPRAGLPHESGPKGAASSTL
jgi:hypothetical protein